LGVAGSSNAFSLSLYNLKAYSTKDPLLRREWDFKVIQHPLIQHQQFELKVKEHASFIVDMKPTLVGFSVYMWNVKYFEMLSLSIKSQAPEIKLVWGGPEIDSEHVRQGKFDGMAIDFCVSGEGEQTFFELLQSLLRDSADYSRINGLSYRDSLDASFEQNEKREAFHSLGKIPSPFLTGNVDDEVLMRRGVEANIETQRGCNLRCSFCIYHKDMPRISYADVTRTIDEIRFVINKGVKKIRLVDANFGSTLEHAKAVMNGIIENKFETRLMVELIPGFIDEELAELFYEFNALYPWNEMTLGIGVQTINLQVAKKVRRGIKLEEFERTFDLIQKYQVYAKIDLIVGLPGEDLESIAETFEYMMDKMIGSTSHLLCCHVLRGLPGTELLEIAKEEEMQFTSEFEAHELYESPTLPRKNMLKALRRTAVMFRLVNHSGWTKREFIFQVRSEGFSIRDNFVEARNKLCISNVELIDVMVDGLMKYLGPESYFVQERFPYAETWWWSMSKVEIPDKWIIDFLQKVSSADMEVVV